MTLFGCHYTIGCIGGACERCQEHRRLVGHMEKEWRAFLVERGLTQQGVEAARIRALAKMREPSTDGLTRVTVDEPSDHPHIALASIDDFLARYTDEQFETAMVELFGERWRAR